MQINPTTLCETLSETDPVSQRIRSNAGDDGQSQEAPATKQLPPPSPAAALVPDKAGTFAGGAGI